ncbi:MAG: Nif3-like dinuclear metal center hexameric protein [Phycisphaerales bacterium]|nr:MAG: Nif3-like dinuclear metal center hexameric protein [Phycisphaerales bacterium]
MNVREVVEAIEAIAPLDHACDWDNVGLLIGSHDWSGSPVMLTIDLTEEVLREAIEAKVKMIIAYHPVIFEPFTRLTDATTRQRIVLEAARAGISVHSPHTALDAAPGGVNDWLAEGLGSGDTRALDVYESSPRTEERKIVTFCPVEAVDQLRNSLAAVGAGRIGEYELCSFEIPGTGTFLGGENTDPAVGEKGTLQRVDEVRLEMVCPADAVALAVMAVREFHPYEEPPIEIYRLQPRPMRGVGIGRRIRLDQPASLKSLAQRIKSRLGVAHLRASVGRNAPSRYSTIGLCPGAGVSVLDEAIRQGCELFLTGEMRHHDLLSAQARGCTVVLAGHTNTERGYLKILAKRLQQALPEVAFLISEKDEDPLKAM